MPRTLTLVSVTRWPDEITWMHSDGSIEVTNEDISTPAGRTAIATRAAALGLGSRGSNFQRLTRHAATGETGAVLEDGGSDPPAADAAGAAEVGA